MTPDWVISGLLSGAGTILLGIVAVWINKQFSKRQDKANIRKTDADALKTFREADNLHFRLTDEFEKMVDEKTKDLSSVIVKNEIRHSKEVEAIVKNYAEKLATAERSVELYAMRLEEAMKKIELLEKKVHNLEMSKG